MTPEQASTIADLMRSVAMLIDRVTEIEARLKVLEQHWGEAQRRR